MVQIHLEKEFWNIYGRNQVSIASVKPGKRKGLTKKEGTVKI